MAGGSHPTAVGEVHEFVTQKRSVEPLPAAALHAAPSALVFRSTRTGKNNAREAKASGAVGAQLLAIHGWPQPQRLAPTRVHQDRIRSFGPVYSKEIWSAAPFDVATVRPMAV